MAYINDNEKLVIRTSLIKAYMKCQAFAMFRYFKGIVVMPRSYQTFGSAFHSTTEHHYKKKVKKGTNEKLSVLKDVFHETFKEKAKTTQWNKDENKDKIERQGTDIVLPEYYKKRAVILEPKLVEESFAIELPEVNATVTGQIDLVLENNEIRDHKTRQRRANWLEPIKSIQGKSYTAGFFEKFKKLPKGFALDYIIRKQTSAEVETSKVVKPTKDTISDFKALAIRVIKSIRQGNFYPVAEGNYLCNPKTCGFWNICQVRGQWKNVGQFTKVFGSNEATDDLPEED